MKYKALDVWHILVNLDVIAIESARIKKIPNQARIKMDSPPWPCRDGKCDHLGWEWTPLGRGSWVEMGPILREFRCAISPWRLVFFIIAFNGARGLVPLMLNTITFRNLQLVVCSINTPTNTKNTKKAIATPQKLFLYVFTHSTI